MDRLYVILRGDLSPGRKIAQAIHAAHEFADTFPDKYRSWRDVSNRIVVCEVPDESSLRDLYRDLHGRGVSVVGFIEPDYMDCPPDTLTAISAEPSSRLRKLPLAFSVDRSLKTPLISGMDKYQIQLEISGQARKLKENSEAIIGVSDMLRKNPSAAEEKLSPLFEDRRKISMRISEILMGVLVAGFEIRVVDPAAESKSDPRPEVSPPPPPPPPPQPSPEPSTAATKDGIAAAILEINRKKNAPTAILPVRSTETLAFRFYPFFSRFHPFPETFTYEEANRELSFLKGVLEVSFLEKYCSKLSLQEFRLAVQYIVARARHLKEFCALNDGFRGMSKDLGSCLGVLPGFVKTRSPGFINGLAFGHTPNGGSWYREAVETWGEISRNVLAEKKVEDPSLPLLPPSNPNPDPSTSNPLEKEEEEGSRIDTSPLWPYMDRVHGKAALFLCGVEPKHTRIEEYLGMSVSFVQVDKPRSISAYHRQLAKGKYDFLFVVTNTVSHKSEAQITKGITETPILRIRGFGVRAITEALAAHFAKELPIKERGLSWPSLVTAGPLRIPIQRSKIGSMRKKSGRTLYL